jgi:hypothetical protein
MNEEALAHWRLSRQKEDEDDDEEKRRTPS